MRLLTAFLLCAIASTSLPQRIKNGMLPKFEKLRNAMQAFRG